MFVKSESYNLLQASCGISISFSEIKPVNENIAKISKSSRLNNISTLIFSELTSSKIPKVGDKIIVTSSSATPLDSSYVGTFNILTVSSDGLTITYKQVKPDLITTQGAGEVFIEKNIETKDDYLLEYNIVSSTIDTNSITISPKSYTISGNNNFIPVTSLKIQPLYSTFAKILLKCNIKDLYTNQILFSEYKEIVISDSVDKFCATTQASNKEYFYLSNNNNWSYYNNNYLIAKFIPINSKNITVKLIKKDSRFLPQNQSSNRLKIIADPIKMQTKRITIDQIRSAVVKQSDDIENAFTVANTKNKSYDIILSNIFLDNNSFNDLIVGYNPPVTGSPVKFSEVAKSEIYDADIIDIPSICIIKYNNEYLGELHYNNKVYDNEDIRVIYNGLELCGKILDVTNGINLISVCTDITKTPTQTPTVTPTISVTPTITPTQTRTSTVTPTATRTCTPTSTVTPTITLSPTATCTPTISLSPSATITPTPTVTPTLTTTPTPTVTPTITTTPTNTNTPTATVTPTISVTPSLTPTISVTPSTTPFPLLNWRNTGSLYWPYYTYSINKTIQNGYSTNEFYALSNFAGGNDSFNSSVVMSDGQVFCIPYSSTTARIYFPGIGSISTPNGTYTGSSAYIGGSLLRDGRIFMVPYNSNSAAIFDPISNSRTILSGPGNGFTGSLLMTDGRVFLVPRNRQYASIYNPISNSFSVPNGTYESSDSYTGGVLLPDGRIFIVPLNSFSAKIYDPINDALITPNGTYPGAFAFCGGVLLPDGRVFLVPRSSTTARIYDPSNNTTITPNGTYPGNNAYSCGVLLPNGNIMIVPRRSGNIMEYNPVSDTLSSLKQNNDDPNTPPISIGSLVNPTNAFGYASMTFTGDTNNGGQVFIVPRNETTAYVYGYTYSNGIGSSEFDPNVSLSSYYNK